MTWSDLAREREGPLASGGYLLRLKLTVRLLWIKLTVIGVVVVGARDGSLVGFWADGSHVVDGRRYNDVWAWRGVNEFGPAGTRGGFFLDVARELGVAQTP